MPFSFDVVAPTVNPTDHYSDQLKKMAITQLRNLKAQLSTTEFRVTIYSTWREVSESSLHSRISAQIRYLKIILISSLAQKMHSSVRTNALYNQRRERTASSRIARWHKSDDK